MSILFEPMEINGLRLANRFVRSATWEGMAAPDGSSTPGLEQLMTVLAEGGVGLIITGHSYVEPAGQAGPWQLGIDRDECVPGLKSMTAAVHAGGGRIVMQLAHAGLQADTAHTGTAPLAPSAVAGFTKTPARELTLVDIDRVVHAFGSAARRARAAGFDGVQIHAAHGYLLSQFLSPAFNRRKDAYGGTVSRRARAILETVAAIRQQVGRAYPVLIKMNCTDALEEGLEVPEAVEVARMVQEAGVDAIEISGGTGASGSLRPVRTGITSEDREAYFKTAAQAFRQAVSIPLMLVGGVRSYGVAEAIVTEGIADFISMSRPLIREPALINRWRSGDLRKSFCLSDNKCFFPIRRGKGLYCVVEKSLANDGTISPA